jgi:pimeloyl-ACP methyl ester carboxylesterase
MKTSFKNRENLNIVVEIFEPGRDKLLFLMHGLSSSREEKAIIVIKDIFLDNGYTVVAFDATHSFGESEGLYEDATMTSYYNDLEDVINWSKGQSWYIEPFVMCGHSLGGYCVLAYAEKYSDKVKAVFPLAPSISGELSHEAHKRKSLEAYNKWKETGWNETPSLSKPGLVKRLKWSHMEDRLKHDLYPDINNLKMPVFFIAAENDTSCPVDQVKSFFDKAPSVNKDIKIIEDAPHTWRTEHDLGKLKEYLEGFIRLL